MFVCRQVVELRCVGRVGTVGCCIAVVVAFMLGSEVLVCLRGRRRTSPVACFGGGVGAIGGVFVGVSICPGGDGVWEWSA